MRDERERLPYDARLELPPLVVQAVGVGEGDGRVRPDDPRRHRGAVGLPAALRAVLAPPDNRTRVGRVAVARVASDRACDLGIETP